MTAVAEGQDLAYRARALAQAHPLTATARRYMDVMVAEQQAIQPMPELGTWAGFAYLNGYCVRRVEEVEAGAEPITPAPSPDADALAQLVADAASDLRGGTADRFLLGPEERTIGALERIVASEVERRLDHLRDELDDGAWGELTEYLAWWVVIGYAVRVAETQPEPAP